jgi:hypothetical protein
MVLLLVALAFERLRDQKLASERTSDPFSSRCFIVDHSVCVCVCLLLSLSSFMKTYILD